MLKKRVCLNCRTPLKKWKKKWCERCAPHAYRMSDNARTGSWFFKFKYPASKACGICKKLYPIAEFPWKKKGNKRQRRWMCKECKRLTRKPYESLSKEEKQKRYWERQRTKQAKLNGKRAERRKKPKLPKKHAFLRECTACGDLFLQKRLTTNCPKCEAQYTKEYRERRKLEDPEWYAGEVARISRWKKEHPSSKKRKHRKGDYLPPRHWEIILESFNYTCAYCDSTDSLERDHVVPYSKGGLMRADNVVPACPECNGYDGKLDKDMREWLNDEIRYESILTTMGDVEWQLDFAS